MHGSAINASVRNKCLLCLTKVLHFYPPKRLAVLLRELPLDSHGLPLECPGGSSSSSSAEEEDLHHFEGLGEMLNHSPNATTSVCAELFEVDVARRLVDANVDEL